MATAKALEPAFQGVGSKPGVEIWRIENFKPVPLPKADYGKFYSGDSYVVLQTSGRAGAGAYTYDIHFWLGKDTSQDEAGVAAIKTVELDAILGGRAVQHRELQNHESDKFISYFKPCIIPLEGGVASGFKKPEEEEFVTRLYTCKGKRVVHLKQVPFSRSVLNHDDVFILDTKDKIFQFNGANSNIQERAKALEVVQFLKDTYHEGTCNVAIVDDGKLQAEGDSGEFWVIFGGFAPIGKKVLSDDDVVPDKTPGKLYSIAGGQVADQIEEYSKSTFENDKCYLMDCGDEVFVWVGRSTQVDDRKAAMKAAEEFLTSNNRPKATLVTRLIQGYETHSFKSNFDSWPSSTAPSAENRGKVAENRGKVSALLKQQGVGPKGKEKNAPVVEEVVPPLLEANGKLEVWSIDGDAKTPVASEDIGKFYSGDCYIVLYSYHSREKKEDFYLCYWIGKDSTEEDQNTAAKLTASMFNSLKGRPVQGRIYQEKEPPQFIAIFQPMVVFKGGLSSGYKSHIAEKGLDDETYKPDSASVIQILGTAVHNNKATQLDPVASSLNSHECFVIQSGSHLYIWQGTQSTYEQHAWAAKIAEFVKPGVHVKYQKEGSESASFWLGLGGKDTCGSNKVSLDTNRDPHLFAFSLSKGKFEIEEVYNFDQDDLLPEDILILDTRAEVIVWIGQAVDQKEKKNALEYGQKYIELAESLDGLSPHVPLYKVTEGNEPCFFTVYFSWEASKTSIPGNSFQKKVTILFGAGHSAGHANKGGGSQRRAAVAALSGVLTNEKTIADEPPPADEPEQSEEAPEEPVEPSEPIPEDDDSEPKVAIEEDENGILSSQSTFTYEQVRVKSEDTVPGIDLKRREAYLSVEEFESVLGMTKEEFYKLPKWKQDLTKKKVDLF
ncbi:putative villin/Gelsolin, ADF-H/Gelsolin-like domain superfamily [Helianthus annuus]|uniref:Villin/Gelsolin, ADF-H/Gelsolin-like domain superfamily n=1 Tax=Helianthus annuus TaxID=4232 RepID=A0A9K3HAL7_HELAN|nr:villin-3 isoform X1 [Helianthus annuus]XP_035837778.1 villin-3 isoform X1 [Helianthus annuus]XP_035837779.1 villin-3 isoform X1 [Helianthus annuus]XP_035837780.1 villin-3 isoform X1 [Helianthus annuus]XP_035837782.1 villin-3 isoform X1 [Helianthus annuus]XP_035837783.1 villin-3 isoform X1 [Helianthus annuus]KAF5772063.1 putative villin/Gelsolin, ADF-H/Gelsolin-like domain superfamily [Helianthus annuus]KAJ0496534.1 putative villin headpiece, villin/Gelsolin, ADF-H/Gelsolin-like domain sup